MKTGTDIFRRLAAALVGAGLAIGGLASSASATTQARFPYFSNPQNDCTGEFMVFEGTAHLVIDVTENADGSFRVFEHFDTQGVTAIGVASGDQYVLSEVTNTRQSYDVTAQPVESQTVHHLVVIHPGESLPNDDRYEHVLVRTTWSGGVPTVVFQSTRTECK